MNTIDEYIEQYLYYKISLGYLGINTKFYLNKYAEFERTQCVEKCLDIRTVEAYLATLHDRPMSLADAAGAIRGLQKYLKNCGIEVEILDRKVGPHPTHAPPYFFTEHEIKTFFHVADSLKPAPGHKGRELIVPTLFRLIYCLGLRCIETRRLHCADVRCAEGYINIRESKGYRSRRVYIRPDLAHYLDAYNKKIAVLYPAREFFFPSRQNSMVSSLFISGNFKKIWYKAFPDFHAEHWPRAYDLRHHFAWTNINGWVRDGKNVDAMLPYLMHCMGHASVNDTLYYFHFVPEFHATYSDIAMQTEDVLPEVPE